MKEITGTWAYYRRGKMSSFTVLCNVFILDGSFQMVVVMSSLCRNHFIGRTSIEFKVENQVR